jgi:hypothetical protein
VSEQLNPWQAGQPDGGVGAMVGDEGFVLLGYLCDDHPHSGLASWQLEDSVGLWSWLGLERKLQTLPLPQELDTDDQRLPFELLTDRFHRALPYSEAERQWIVGTHPPEPPRPIPLDQGTLEEEQERYHERYFGLEARIISAGLIRVISGRDLMRRWISWRSETDEYTGQGSLDLARDTLADLIKLVAPDEIMPSSYLSLRRSQEV